MGCACSSETLEKTDDERRARKPRENHQIHYEGGHHPNTQSEVIAHQNLSNRRTIERMRDSELQLSQNQPSYEPYLQSKHNPTFDMAEINEYVGEGIKKMKGYICQIEEDDLKKKRNDFWSSRFEGNEEIWCLLQSFCTGEFTYSELPELIKSTGLTTYAGCINVLYDSKGNLYEIPNYCIHDPSVWDIPKLCIEEPKEMIIKVRLRIVATDYILQVSNKDSISNLKRHLQKEINKLQPGSVQGIELLRLFYRGSELKDKDKIFMHNLENDSIILGMITKDV